MRSLDPGVRVGPYEIVGLLGRGGMGEVYRARDIRLQRDVAVKVLPAELADDSKRLQQFGQEALATAALNQANILAIYDVGTHEGRPYLVSELLEGQTLRDHLASAGRLPSSKAIGFARQVAQGLAAAHAKGIVHRDLKPENLFLTSDGRAKILDFGIAKVTGHASDADAATITEAVAIPGTVEYMSPEQLRGQRVDARSDLFSLGVVLYEMIAGRRPFQAASRADTVSAILASDPPRLGTHAPAVSPALEATVARCLEKRPEDRFQSAADLEFSLSAVQGSEPGGAGEPHAHRPRYVTRRMRTLLWLGAAAGVLALTLSPWAGTRRAAPANASVASPSRSPVASSRRVVAVLPFKNISRDGGQDYFAAGITEEIHGQLSRIAGLRLVGRSSIERLAATSLRALADDLGAGSFVGGSVRMDGQRVRIAVELVDARTGQTMWSQQFDRELRDIFAVQREIALNVAGFLDASPSTEERRRLDERRPTQDLAAYDLYLRAEQERDRRKAIAMYEKVVQMDPRFADAYAGLAYHMMFAAFEHPEYREMALAAARKAVALDPLLPSAQMTLATVYSERGLLADARVAFLRALDLNPNHATSMKNLSVLEIELGRYDEAFLWAIRAFRAAPRPQANDYYHAAVPLVLLDENAAERWLVDAERQFPADARIGIMRATLDARRNRLTESLGRARRLAVAEDPDGEALLLASEVAYLAGAQDAEAFTERLFRQIPGITGAYWFMVESPRVRYAHLLARRGQGVRAERLLGDALAEALHALDAGRQSPRMLVEVAIIHALRRQHAAALAFLERAWDAGLRDHRMLAPHPAFAGFSRDHRFRALLQRMVVAVEAMRARADVDRAIAQLTAGGSAPIR